MKNLTGVQLLELYAANGVMKNEKDRFGQKVKFDERANEDTYFVVKEHACLDHVQISRRACA